MFHVKHDDSVAFEFTLAREGRAEIVERRSRFIGVAFFLSLPEEMKQKLEELRIEFPKASHYCFAFQLGMGKSKIQGASDDGEPKGTAGRPMLDVLVGKSISNAGIIVVRYFGGTKLGTGGLVRAYQAAAKAALEQATHAPFVSRETISVQIPYRLHGALRQVLESFAVEIVHEDFAAEVRVDFRAESRDVETIKEKIVDLSSGLARFIDQGKS